MATGAPGANGVWLYGEDDSEATFSALLNKAGSTVNTQLGADRARLSALEARSISGLNPVIPTSVTASGGSGSFSSSTGKVTFGAGTTALTVNGVFTSAYANYRIVINTLKGGTTANDFLHARLTSVGTPNSNATYYSGALGILPGTGATQNLGGNGITYFIVNRLNDGTVYSSAEFDLYRPNESVWTTITGQAIGNTSGSNQFIITGGVHQQSVQFDGINLFMSANSMSGTVSIYGYED